MATKTPVLMSPENPEGWKLEELCNQLAREVYVKIEKIKDDRRPQARVVHRNNEQIIGLLQQVAALQRLSMDRLEEIGPNQGPLGTPRIGTGSNPPGDPS